MNLRSGEELTLSKPQHCKNQIKYLEEFWRPEESCCNSDFSEKPPVRIGVKNSQRVKKKPKKLEDLVVISKTNMSASGLHYSVISQS